MNSTIEKIYSLMNNGDYEEAVSLIEQTEVSSIINPTLLVLKGICLQQGNNESKYSLLDIENMFKEAYELDKECIDAVVELAWFNLNVNDDSKMAISLFEDAFKIYSSKLTQVVIGIAKCLTETNSPKEALNYLEMAKNQVLDFKEMEILKEEIKETIES
jgi:tetratricopeptide (TPR) repeat protein